MYHSPLLVHTGEELQPCETSNERSGGFTRKYAGTIIILSCSYMCNVTETTCCHYMPER